MLRGVCRVSGSGIGRRGGAGPRRARRRRPSRMAASRFAQSKWPRPTCAPTPCGFLPPWICRALLASRLACWCRNFRRWGRCVARASIAGSDESESGGSPRKSTHSADFRVRNEGRQKAAQYFAGQGMAGPAAADRAAQCREWNSMESRLLSAAARKE